MGEATCVTLGFETGRVVCTEACQYSTALCVKRCGNGVVDPGETCDGTLNVPACTNWGFNACTDACVVDTRSCLSTSPFETAPELVVSHGGRTVLGDMAPTGPGDLVMVVPSFDRIEIFPWNMTRGFEATGSRKLSFLRTPRFHELLDANGDGVADVVTQNSDGSYDLLLGGDSYSLVMLDGGLPDANTFLPSDGSLRREAIGLGANSIAVITGGGVTEVPTPQRRAIARGPHGLVWADATHLHLSDGGTSTLPDSIMSLGTADFDGDGDEDLAGIGNCGVCVYENTGSGFAERVRWNIATGAGNLRVLDFDQDGRPDVYWSSLDGFNIRRNDGAFSFTQHTVSTPGAPRYPATIGDADGDQDLDVAFTFPGTDGAHTTRIWRNRVR